MKFKIGDRVRINPQHEEAPRWPESVQRAIRANHVFVIEGILPPERFEPIKLDTSSWPYTIADRWTEDELVHARKPTIVVML